MLIAVGCLYPQRKDPQVNAFPFVRWALAGCAVLVVLVAPVQRRAAAYDQEGHVFCKYSYSGSGLIYPVLRNDPDLPPTDFVGLPQAYEDARSDWNATSAPVSMILTSSGEAWIGAYFMGVDGPYGHTSEYCTWPSNNRYASDTYLNMSRVGGFSANEKRQWQVMSSATSSEFDTVTRLQS
jgi:hypothetical protein